MNMNEIGGLLTMVSATYDRAIPPGKDRMWLEVLGHLPAQLGRAALIETMREQEWPPSPAMVLAKAREITARQRDLDRRQARAITAGTKPAQDDLGPKPPGGAAMIAFVLEGLASERAAFGRKLGPEFSSRVAQELIDEWRAKHPSSTVLSRTGEPCVNAMCPCTHTGGCEAGWIHHDNSTVTACRTCNLRRATILASGDRRATAQHKLRDTSDIKATSSPGVTS